MRLDEFKSYMESVPPPIKGKDKGETSAAWETLTNEDLERLAVQLIEAEEERKDDGEVTDTQQVTERDLAKALSLLSEAALLMTCLADKDSTPKLTQRDRDDLEQVSGDIDDFMDEFDEDWWQEEVKGKV